MPINPNSGYLRFPAIQGDTVVFVCEDDLWLTTVAGGTAWRLTAGVSEVSHPRLSPDGDRVAFVGADDGPTEVYVLTLASGSVCRLTFQAARCAVVGWHPATGEILYASTAEQPPGFGYRLFAVDPAGGPPRVLPFGQASSVSFGPDGGVVLGRNTADPARWKRYRGGTAGELWIDPDGTGGYRRLIELPGNVGGPCWVGDRIFFVSDHGDVGNVYSCRPDGTGLARHTGHDDFYARNLASDGRRLVYHAGAALYLLDGEGNRRLDVRLPSARFQRNRRYVPAADFLHSATLAPDGAGLAVAARGKAFSLGNWDGPVRQHGAPDGVRYQLLTWLNDGRRLVAAAADERPDEWLAILSADSATPPVELSTMDLGRVVELAVSPVHDRVAVANHRNELHVVDLDGEPAARRVDQSPHGPIEDLAWSPDGRWLAYARPQTPQTTAIMIADAASDWAAHPVTRPVLRDFAPAFDPGGRYLYFVGQRDFTPAYDQLGFGLGFPHGTRPYLVTLRADAPSPFVPTSRPFGTGDDAPEPGPVTIDVAIDLDGIDRRVVPFPVAEGRYRKVLGVPGKVLLLSTPVAEPSGVVELFDFATLTADEYVTGVDDIDLSRDATTLLCHAGRRLRVVRSDVDPDGDEHPGATGDDDEPGRSSGWIDLDRIKVSVRPEAEWRQMFREAWRMQRDHFWDQGMSGVDWDAVYRRYLPLVDLVASRAELSDLIWELQGELGTSHAYEFGGEYRPRPRYAQGFLGVDWRCAGGEWRIGRILDGDRWNPAAASPCHRLGVDLRPGDVVLALGGQPIGPAGPGELLVNQAGQEVELVVRRDAAPHRVTVRALGDEGPLRYRDWVTANRRYVRRATGGRAGYLHVPNMLDTGYAEFMRAYLAEHDRDGLIIDVRFNGGGHVSWLLLEKLARRRLGYDLGRWNGPAPYPAESPRGPMVAITNEHAGSDGDIFSHLFKRLGLGPLVGRRTWGGVVATWPRHSLVDGTVTTQPEFCYTFDDVGRGLENRGTEPDIEVDAPPGHTGADPQLARAVEVLMARLESLPSALLIAASGGASRV